MIASPIEYHRRMLARNCWFGGGPHGECEGRLDRMHWIPKQLLRREFPQGVVRCEGAIEFQPHGRAGWPEHAEVIGLKRLLADERLWSWGCRKHHGMLDFSRKIRVARADLPESVEEFAAQLGLTWWLDREYGERPRV